MKYPSRYRAPALVRAWGGPARSRGLLRHLLLLDRRRLGGIDAARHQELLVELLRLPVLVVLVELDVQEVAERLVVLAANACARRQRHDGLGDDHRALLHAR